jgi:hypothetical protein
MKKKDINQKVLDDMGLASPKRHVRKPKRKKYGYHRYAGHDDVTDVFEALKKMLKRHRKKFEVIEEEKAYWLALPATEERPRYNLFGAYMNKGYVSFHHAALSDKSYDKRFPKQLQEIRHGWIVLNFIDIDRPRIELLEKEVVKVIGMAEASGYI